MGSDEEREDDDAADDAERDGAGDGDSAASEVEEAPKPRKKKRKKRSKKRSADGEPRPKKKRAKKKRPADGEDAAEGDAKKDEDAPKRRIPWLAIILTIAAVELFLFGNRGRLEVCVGKEGVHDFALVGTPRTDENTASYPACETRLNIGMKSRYDELKTDAVVQACRRANIFRGKEAILTCAVEAEGWTHRIDAAFVPPWDPDYRKRLFWFLE